MIIMYLKLFCAVSSQIIQRRLAHSDIRVPDFDYYRRDSVKSPNANSRETAPSRQAVTYLVGAGKF